MTRQLVVISALVLLLTACPAPPPVQTANDNGGTTTGGETTGGETTEGGTTTGGETTGGDTTGGGTTTGGTTGTGGKTVEWTQDPNVPGDAIAGRTMNTFSGYQDAEGMRLYFCGEDGVLRIRPIEGGEWRDQDLSTSDTIQDCHVSTDDLMAAVGDTGKVWKWAGTQNWSSSDLIAESPNLRAVWITNLATLHVAGVQGAMSRLDNSTWTDERVEGVTSTINDMWGPGGGIIWAVGDNVILSYDGTEWTSEALPDNYPVGTPEANKGFNAKAVHGTDAENIWAVGDKAAVAYRGSDGVWTFQDPDWGGGTPFNAVWGRAGDDVFIAGAKGIVRQYIGEDPWSSVAVKTPKKTPLGDKWPAERSVPLDTNLLNYVGIFGTGDQTWLFTGNGTLIRHDDQYEL